LDTAWRGLGMQGGCAPRRNRLSELERLRGAKGVARHRFPTKRKRDLSDGGKRDVGRLGGARVDGIPTLEGIVRVVCSNKQGQEKKARSTIGGEVRP